jgi:hypothetical protein
LAWPARGSSCSRVEMGTPHMTILERGSRTMVGLTTDAS